MKECFGNDLIVFTISGFLPGEYSLRTFPLICKVTQSLRLSISLRPYSSPTWWDFEGPIYGIYSKWQDFERVLSRGHLVTALWVEGDILGNIFNTKRNAHLITPISSVKELYLSKPQLSFSPAFSSLNLFPSLITLVVSSAEIISYQLLSAIWKLSTLRSLTMTGCGIDPETVQQYSRRGNDVGGPAPAFAHSLHTLVVEEKCLLDLLAPFCRTLQHITSPVDHEIMLIPTLTSLSISYVLSRSAYRSPPSTIDLTPHSQLIKLHIASPHPFTSQAIHLNLEEVSFTHPRTDDVCQFLTQCPRLKQLTISECKSWQDMVKIISVLNSKTCKLNMYPDGSVDEVEEMILQKGFQIMNDDFFFRIGDAVQRWGRVLELAPNMENCQRLSGTLDTILHDSHFIPSFFASFPALSVLDLQTNLEWSEDMLSGIARTCSMLKVLKVFGYKYSGALELQLVSLRQVDLNFFSPFSAFSFKLPNLIHLYLKLYEGESILLQGLLNGDDPLIQLPRLRVFLVHLSSSQDRADRLASSPAVSPVTAIQCKAGHESLIQVNMAGNRETEISELITFQNVPCLREITLTLPSTVQLVLDIPGHCDISLSTKRLDPSYTRQGYSQGSDQFVTQLSCDDEEGWFDRNLHTPIQSSGALPRFRIEIPRERVPY